MLFSVHSYHFDSDNLIFIYCIINIYTQEHQCHCKLDAAGDRKYEMSGIRMFCVKVAAGDFLGRINLLKDLTIENL